MVIPKNHLIGMRRIKRFGCIQGKNILIKLKKDSKDDIQKKEESTQKFSIFFKDAEAKLIEDLMFDENLKNSENDIDSFQDLNLSNSQNIRVNDASDTTGKIS